MASRVRDILQRGLRSAQPAASAVDVGTLYFVTDENVTERSNGSTWDSYSGPAGGNVAAAGVLGDNKVIRGNGGLAGVQDSGVTVDDSDNVTGVATLAVGGALKAGSKATFNGQYVSPLVADGDSGTAKTIDFAAGNEHYLTLTGNVTLTFSNPVDGGRYVVNVNTGAGGFTVTWPAKVRWSGSTPVVTATAGKLDLFTFEYIAALDLYFGAYQQNYAAS